MLAKYEMGMPYFNTDCSVKNMSRTLPVPTTSIETSSDIHSVEFPRRCLEGKGHNAAAP